VKSTDGVGSSRMPALLRNKADPLAAPHRRGERFDHRSVALAMPRAPPLVVQAAMV